jgi:hypothetical protein
VFKLKTSRKNPKTYISQEISDSDLQTVFQELQRIAQLENPRIDSTLEPIRLTNGVWDRMKQLGQPWRAILYVDKDSQEITLFAVLTREDDTYSQTVRGLWTEWSE